MRRHRGGASRPSSRGQGSASMTPPPYRSTNGPASWRQARRLWFAGVVICSLVLAGRRSHTVAVEPRRGKSPLAIESIDGRYCFAARRDAVAACATCRDLRMAERTVAALFAAAMETIHAGYWKISYCAAINGYMRRRSHQVTLRATSLGLRNSAGVDQIVTDAKPNRECHRRIAVQQPRTGDP